MKKVYAAMALALAIGASANANVNPAEMEAMQLGTKASMELTSFAKGEEVAGPKKAAQKFDSVNDLYGYMTWRYAMGLQGYNGWQMGSISITPSEKEGYVTVTGLFGGYPVEAKYDLEAMTLSFYRQPLFYNSYYDMDIDLVPMYWSSDSSVDNLPDGKPIVIGYRPDGIEIEGEMYYKEMWTFSDENDILGVTQDGLGGYFGLMYLNIFYPIDLAVAETRLNGIFEYNASEWKLMGKASLTEGWVGPLVEEDGQVGPYDVEVYQNVKEGKRILLKDPYGPATPFSQLNEGTGEGYIVLNCYNTDCVLVEPLVPSGLEIGGYGMFFNSSEEGVLYYMQNTDIDEIIETNEFYFRENPTMDGTVIMLPNCRVALVDDVFSYIQWSDNETKELAEMVSMIELPDDMWDGVEGITDDVNTGVNRYFNLQGMEVSPVKGQIVIVRNGNKSTKMVVR